MENNRLFELADELKALRDRKDALEAELKQVNMDIDNVDCSPLYYSSYRRASACPDCSTRGRQTCGLPCIFRGTRRTSPFPRSSRRSNLWFLCGCRHRNGCGCRRHWSD